MVKSSSESLPFLGVVVPFLCCDQKQRIGERVYFGLQFQRHEFLMAGRCKVEAEFTFKTVSANERRGLEVA